MAILMVAFDNHNYCASCHDKGKGSNPCLLKQDCGFCIAMTSDQQAQLATPSYKLKKDKRDLKSDKCHINGSLCLLGNKIQGIIHEKQGNTAL